MSMTMDMRHEQWRPREGRVGGAARVTDGCERWRGLDAILGELPYESARRRVGSARDAVQVAVILGELMAVRDVPKLAPTCQWRRSNHEAVGAGRAWRGRPRNGARTTGPAPAATGRSQRSKVLHQSRREPGPELAPSAGRQCWQAALAGRAGRQRWQAAHSASCIAASTTSHSCTEGRPGTRPRAHRCHWRRRPQRHSR